MVKAMKDGEVMLDTEMSFEGKRKPDKVLVVGRDDVDMSRIVAAARAAGTEQLIVVDSIQGSAPEGCLEVFREEQARRAYEEWMEPVLRGRRRKVEKIYSKCGLPGCEVVSAKDYCCAQHCLEHRRIQKGRPT